MTPTNHNFVIAAAWIKASHKENKIFKISPTWPERENSGCDGSGSLEHLVAVHCWTRQVHRLSWAEGPMWCSMVWVIPWSGTKHLVSIFLKKWTLACTAWHTPCLAPNSAASPASGLRRPPPHSAAHLDASAARLPSPNPTPPARLLGTRPGRRLPPPTASPTPPALATRLSPRSPTVASVLPAQEPLPPILPVWLETSVERKKL
jgi:hypothetical protein